MSHGLPVMGHQSRLIILDPPPSSLPH
jgi:hypothetical protein